MLWSDRSVLKSKKLAPIRTLVHRWYRKYFLALVLLRNGKSEEMFKEVKTKKDDDDGGNPNLKKDKSISNK